MKCKACLLTCMDFRLNEIFDSIYKEENVKPDDVDVIRFPGSVKQLLNSDTRNIFLDAIKLSVDAHSSQQIILVNHENCKAYGDATDEKNVQSSDLSKARDLVASEINGVSVNSYYLKLDGTFLKV